MSNIWIATNVDELYYKKKSKDWIHSVQKHKGDCIPMLFAIDFRPDERISSVSISKDKIKYSTHKHLKSKKRDNFVCLESGEFLDYFYFLDEEDIVILTDWDITMQRPLSASELELISNLGDNFGVTKDSYSSEGTNLKTSGKENSGYLGANNIFSDLEEDWTVYNTGVQIANVRTWRKFYKIWQKLYPKVISKCNHHATGQMLFNYIVHKHSMITALPPTMHNGTWFDSTKATYGKENQLSHKDSIVLFNHHKFITKPNF